MVHCKKGYDERIVVFGQSCVGKTFFSRCLTEHFHYCFDSLFQWHLIESLGLSASANLQHVQNECTQSPFVLDGWHLSDKEGKFLPNGSVVYVVYAPYRQIINQYRIPVTHEREFFSMFVRWYCDVPYDLLPGSRFFKNDGDFFETSAEEFGLFIEEELANNHFLEIL